jgi:hypothetical protein
MLQKIGNVLPYKVGDKLKIYVRDVTISNQSAVVTYGRVVLVDHQGMNPMVEYEDFRALPLWRFNRFVSLNEVTFVSRPKKANYDQFKNVNGVLRQI